MSSSAANDRIHFLRVGVGLECFSIAWMVVEGSVGLSSGLAVHSLALEAFGVDSVLEILSAGIVLWWLLLALRGANPEHIHEAGERVERLVGVGLLLLVLYVGAGASYQLVTQTRPDTSLAGVILAAVAAAVMPVLFLLKRYTAERLQSGAMRGDADESLTCGWMALTVLIGLALRRIAGWWWADPVAALLLVPLLLREAWESVHA
jgi:divalent metal cation (Fe/Co/Zn/Cd) transporter